MLTFRRTVSLLLICVGLVCSLGALVTSGVGLEDSIAKSRVMDGEFRRAAAAIGGFERAHGRLPSPAEFDADLAFNAHGPYQIRLASPGFRDCDGVIPAISQLQPPNYVLTAWRGEWTDCYAPTMGLSTLGLTPDDYAMLGSAALDHWVFGGGTFTCFLLAILLWRRWGAEREQ